MRPFLALAALLATLSLHADPRLVEPRDGAELAGGSLVTIEWAGDVAPDVQEWEAFLSVDGGRWFSTRITPHLDACIRHFTFEVPNVTATNTRILLRFGDEKREREVDVPSRFTIRFDPAAVRTRIAFSRGYGESARPGSRAVAQWVTGARDGSGLQTFVRRESSCSESQVAAIASAHDENAESEDGESAVPARATRAVALVTTDRVLPGARTIPRASDLLLSTRRLNL